MARRGAQLRQRLSDLIAKVGSFYSLRENFRLTAEVKQKFTEKLRRDPEEFHGMKVAQAATTDGAAAESWIFV